MKRLLLWIQLIPALISAVKQVEETVPLPQKGKEKLELVLGIIKVLYDAGLAGSEFPWDKLVGIITGAVSVIVSALNALGVFKKG